MKLDLASRHALLCRAVASTSEPTPVHLELDALEKLLRQDLLELARKGSPPHFAEILLTMEQELARFRELCEFPVLAQKVVVGFGGAFSSGKSTLLNAFLGQPLLLATEVDPTTSVPTYLLHGEHEDICAINHSGRKVSLNPEEFHSLTHDEKDQYGSAIGHLFRSAFLTQPNLPWRNLALLDTPGYSKPETESWCANTDERIARSQLNTVQCIVWVLSVEAGTIPENDLAFIASLRQDIPRLVVISHADKKPQQDVADIVELVKRTLAERGLPVLAVMPVSVRKPATLAPLLAQLQQWNEQAPKLGVAKSFKREFTHYARFLEAEQRTLHQRLHRLNRILSLTEELEVCDEAKELQAAARHDLDQRQVVLNGLNVVRQQFFKRLEKIGDVIGVSLAEPSEIDMLDVHGIDLIGLFRSVREKQGNDEVDHARHWRSLGADVVAQGVAELLRRTAQRHRVALTALSMPVTSTDSSGQPNADTTLRSIANLLRRVAQRHLGALTALSNPIITNIGTPSGVPALPSLEIILLGNE